jgi:O-antigen/teichoic acid export membrane protein
VTTSSQDRRDDGYAGAIARGTLFNLLGTVARLGHPLFLLVVTWLWGSAFAGLYLLALAMMEITASAIIDAPSDATVVFASHHAEAAAGDDRVRRELHRVLATAMRVALGLAIPVAILTLVAGSSLIERFFPEYGEMVPGIYVLGASLIPRALSQTAIAATKAMLHMEHDALLNGVFHPLALLGASLLVFALGGGFLGLLVAQLVVECLLCALAWRSLARYVSLRELAAALVELPADRRVLGFVFPQGLNLTFNRYITRLDSIMLAAFGLGKSELAYFSTAALITSNLAQIRMVFSGALAPVVARLHAARQREAFEETLGRVCRWTTSMVVPVVCVVIVFREDLLRLISPDYGHDSLFVVILLIPPLGNCAYGLAGACLMFTGHSRTTLANSLSIAILNTGLTFLLIPPCGMLGAAVATAMATSLMTGLQMIELWKLERVAIRWRAVWKPHLGLAVALLPLALTWDPAALGAGEKAAVALLSSAAYVGLMAVLRHEELARLARRLRARRGPAV